MVLDNVKVMYDRNIPLIQIVSPVNMITITNSRLKNIGLRFHGNEVFPKYLKDHAFPDYLKTTINIHGCIFLHDGEMVLLQNTAKGKQIDLKTSSSSELGEGFSAKVIPGGGDIRVQSDLTGLSDSLPRRQVDIAGD